MDDHNGREALGMLASWARQTIVFAITIRDDDTSKNVRDPEVVKRAGREAQYLTNELWKKAAKDFGSNSPIGELSLAYARLVFDWCHQYIHQR
jgi:hypothetical protein